MSRRRTRKALVKLIEEASEVIKAAADVLDGKGTWEALEEEIADVRAISQVMHESATPLVIPNARVIRKFTKYQRKYG